jgi:ankyrin repeat protein
LKIKRPSLKGENIFTYYRDVRGASLLHFAVENRDLAGVKFYSSFPGLLNAKDHAGETALHWCADEGFTEAASLLLSVGADVNSTNGLGQTPAIRAFYSDSSQLLRLLVTDKNFNPEIKDARLLTVAHHAAACGSEEQKEIVVSGLCEKGYFFLIDEEPSVFNPNFLRLYNKKTYRDYRRREDKRIFDACFALRKKTK